MMEMERTLTTLEEMNTVLAAGIVSTPNKNYRFAPLFNGPYNRFIACAPTQLKNEGNQSLEPSMPMVLTYLQNGAKAAALLAAVKQNTSHPYVKLAADNQKNPTYLNKLLAHRYDKANEKNHYGETRALAESFLKSQIKELKAIGATGGFDSQHLFNTAKQYLNLAQKSRTYNIEELKAVNEAFRIHPSTTAVYLTERFGTVDPEIIGTRLVEENQDVIANMAYVKKANIDFNSAIHKIPVIKSNSTDTLSNSVYAGRAHALDKKMGIRGRVVPYLTEQEDPSFPQGIPSVNVIASVFEGKTSDFETHNINIMADYGHWYKTQHEVVSPEVLQAREEKLKELVRAAEEKIEIAKKEYAAEIAKSKKIVESYKTDFLNTEPVTVVEQLAGTNFDQKGIADLAVKYIPTLRVSTQKPFEKSSNSFQNVLGIPLSDNITESYNLTEMNGIQHIFPEKISMQDSTTGEPKEINKLNRIAIEMKKNCMLTLGNPETASVFITVEGVANGLLTHDGLLKQGVDVCTVCALDVGNIPHAIRYISEQHPHKPIVNFADNDLYRKKTGEIRSLEDNTGLDMATRLKDAINVPFFNIDFASLGYGDQQQADRATDIDDLAHYMGRDEAQNVIFEQLKGELRNFYPAWSVENQHELKFIPTLSEKLTDWHHMADVIKESESKFAETYDMHYSTYVEMVKNVQISTLKPTQVTLDVPKIESVDFDDIPQICDTSDDYILTAPIQTIAATELQAELDRVNQQIESLYENTENLTDSQREQLIKNLDNLHTYKATICEAKARGVDLEAVAFIDMPTTEDLKQGQPQNVPTEQVIEADHTDIQPNAPPSAIITDSEAGRRIVTALPNDADSLTQKVDFAMAQLNLSKEQYKIEIESDLSPTVKILHGESAGRYDINTENDEIHLLQCDLPLPPDENIIPEGDFKLSTDLASEELSSLLSAGLVDEPITQKPNGSQESLETKEEVLKNPSAIREQNGLGQLNQLLAELDNETNQQQEKIEKIESELSEQIDRDYSELLSTQHNGLTSLVQTAADLRTHIEAITSKTSDLTNLKSLLKNTYDEAVSKYDSTSNSMASDQPAGFTQQQATEIIQTALQQIKLTNSVVSTLKSDFDMPSRLVNNAIHSQELKERISTALEQSSHEAKNDLLSKREVKYLEQESKRYESILNNHIGELPKASLERVGSHYGLNTRRIARKISAIENANPIRTEAHTAAELLDEISTECDIATRLAIISDGLDGYAPSSNIASYDESIQKEFGFSIVDKVNELTSDDQTMTEQYDRAFKEAQDSTIESTTTDTVEQPESAAPVGVSPSDDYLNQLSQDLNNELKLLDQQLAAVDEKLDSPHTDHHEVSELNGQFNAIKESKIAFTNILEALNTRDAQHVIDTLEATISNSQQQLESLFEIDQEAGAPDGESRGIQTQIKAHAKVANLSLTLSESISEHGHDVQLYETVSQLMSSRKQLDELQHNIKEKTRSLAGDNADLTEVASNEYDWQEKVVAGLKDNYLFAESMATNQVMTVVSNYEQFQHNLTDFINGEVTSFDAHRYETTGYIERFADLEELASIKDDFLKTINTLHTVQNNELLKTTYTTEISLIDTTNGGSIVNRIDELKQKENVVEAIEAKRLESIQQLTTSVTSPESELSALLNGTNPTIEQVKSKVEQIANEIKAEIATSEERISLGENHKKALKAQVNVLRDTPQINLLVADSTFTYADHLQFAAESLNADTAIHELEVSTLIDIDLNVSNDIEDNEITAERHTAVDDLLAEFGYGEGVSLQTESVQDSPVTDSNNNLKVTEETDAKPQQEMTAESKVIQQATVAEQGISDTPTLDATERQVTDIAPEAESTPSVDSTAENPELTSTSEVNQPMSDTSPELYEPSEEPNTSQSQTKIEAQDSLAVDEASEVSDETPTTDTQPKSELLGYLNTQITDLENKTQGFTKNQDAERSITNGSISYFKEMRAHIENTSSSNDDISVLNDLIERKRNNNERVYASRARSNKEPEAIDSFVMSELVNRCKIEVELLDRMADYGYNLSNSNYQHVETGNNVKGLVSELLDQNEIATITIDKLQQSGNQENLEAALNAVKDESNYLQNLIDGNLWAMPKEISISAHNKISEIYASSYDVINSINAASTQEQRDSATNLVNANIEVIDRLEYIPANTPPVDESLHFQRELDELLSQNDRKTLKSLVIEIETTPAAESQIDNTAEVSNEISADADSESIGMGHDSQPHSDTDSQPIPEGEQPLEDNIAKEEKIELDWNDINIDEPEKAVKDTKWKQTFEASSSNPELNNFTQTLQYSRETSYGTDPTLTEEVKRLTTKLDDLLKTHKEILEEIRAVTVAINAMTPNSPAQTQTALSQSAPAEPQTQTALSQSAPAEPQTQTALSQSAPAEPQTQTALSQSAPAEPQGQTTLNQTAPVESQTQTALSQSAPAEPQSQTPIDQAEARATQPYQQQEPLSQVNQHGEEMHALQAGNTQSCNKEAMTASELSQVISGPLQHQQQAELEKSYTIDEFTELADELKTMLDDSTAHKYRQLAPTIKEKVQAVLDYGLEGQKLTIPKLEQHDTIGIINNIEFKTLMKEGVMLGAVMAKVSNDDQNIKSGAFLHSVVKDIMDGTESDELETRKRLLYSQTQSQEPEPEIHNRDYGQEQTL